MQSDDLSQLKSKVLAARILVVKFEIMLYALPDDFIVYVDDNERPAAESYAVTRSRKAYELTGNSKRYARLVSPTEMYNIIKKHLNYETQQLEELEKSSNGLVQVKDKKLTRLTTLLEQLRKHTGANTLLELQPRYTRRSDDEEELYEEAVSLVARTQIADVTLIRDNLSIGHTQAEKLMQRLEGEELVSRLQNGALKRTVLVTVDDMDEREARRNADK